ncbi:uncharacterized protein LOC122850090 [Aphidius gifuensis]|uniref:uncharacterized protein LOC122850090 n=1 Tax=Aphidius gifuensis TaxID=684658 RepID=UPI001CDD5F35|nr:uncharacterized protein LOC122850090 [Aphidius gifuensis]
MNHHDIFHQLEKYEKEKEFDLSPEDNVKIKKICEEFNDMSINSQHLQTILLLLNNLSVDVLSKSETFMSLKEYRLVKFVIEKAVTIGILPCLLPGLVFTRQQSHVQLENLPDMVKYNRLSSTIRVLVDCHDEIALKPAIQTQLNVLLGGLLQLSHAPLSPPTESPPQNPSKFHMTKEIHNKLSQDHEEFTQRLDKFIKSCQLSDIIREMFIYSGSKNIPSWLRKHAKSYIIKSIMQPIGIASLFKVDGITESSKNNSNNIDTITKLIIKSHGPDPDAYFTSVCSQILDFLKFKNSNNSLDIFSSFIINLHDNYPKICQDKIINIIVKPLMIKVEISDDNLILENENNVSLCIENLSKCFNINNREFNNLFCQLIRHISVPLFYMFIKIQSSVLLVKTQVKDILINLLKNDNLTDKLFQVYLELDDNSFGDKLSFKFGSSGGLEIISKIENIEYEKIVNCLYDLVINHDDLSTSLFHYLLKSSVDNSQVETSIENEEKYINKKMELMKLLIKLANNRNIQKAQIKNPINILNFVKLLFDNINNDNNDENIEILYVSLMLIKLILEEEKPNDWQPFDEFSLFLMNKNIQINDNLTSTINEVITIIKNRGIKSSKFYQDTSIDDKNQREFDEALKDTNDPLLPVRAHGLMILTKKIESSDSIALAKKDLLLSIFQKNLTDDDSFVYQIAINGLCALASKYPNELVEILVNVFIDLPNDDDHDDNIITPENRVKLGEIIIKTMKKIGELSYSYKNILINGFLRGTCDNDYLVRASSLSCIGELCQILGYRLSGEIKIILSHIENIITTDKSPEVRRAAVMVTTLLLRGLGKDALVELGQDLLPLYRGIKNLRNNDDDEVLRLHAQLTLEEFDDIVQNFMFYKPMMR